MEEEKRPPLPTRPSQTPTEEKPPTKDPYFTDTSKHQDQEQDQEQDNEETNTNPALPAYTPTVLIQNQTSHTAYRPSSILPKPVVIPRMSPSPSLSPTIYLPT